VISDEALFTRSFASWPRASKPSDRLPWAPRGGIRLTASVVVGAAGAYGTMVYVCQASAAEAGIDAEIIDVRSLVPLDIDTMTASVRKTGRCVIAHEATRFGDFGAELSASIQEACSWHLRAPIARICGWDTPYPHAFEWDYFPGKARVASSLRTVVEPS